ncbi:MAG: acyl--CoA ligase [Bacilli bacterium]|nr:acyl--CoA ligase [Bacilli bacterium]
MENFETLTLYNSVKTTAKKVRHNNAIIYQGKKISFAKFLKLVDKTADILIENLHIEKGDVVIVSQPNIPNVLVLIYALNKIGAVINLVHPFTPFNQMKNIIIKTKTKYAFLFEQRVAKEVEKYREIADMVYVTRIEDYLPTFKKFIYHFMNKDIRKKLGRFRGKFTGFKYVYKLKKAKKHYPVKHDDVNELSVLLHSGSTTGDPKTICLCDRNFNFFVNRAYDITSLEEKDFYKSYFLSFLPSFHGFGFCVTMHTPLALGSGVILMPKFSAKELAKLLNHYRILVTGSVPTALEAMLKCPEFVNSKHLDRMGMVFCGGDTMSPTLEKRFNDTMAKGGSKCRVFEGYGLTEAVGANIVNTFKGHKTGSIGKPIKDVIVKIVDDNGKEVPVGQIGEIILQTGEMMLHYLDNEEGTKEAIRDGWLYTGDYGHVDEEGFVFFDQRKKRVVKVSGVGVFPTEIERLIENIPGVEAACAIEIPDPKLQAAIKVFVVAKYFDEEGMKEQILDTCRKYLIRWAVPKEIEFIKELPHTLLNKIDFKKLQELEDAKRGIKRKK